MNYGEKFKSGLTYNDFLDKYASEGERSRWNAVHNEVKLSGDQKQLLAGFVRDMKVLVAAGTWCGDCVNQLPIFPHFSEASEKIHIRYFDRDDASDLSADLAICGAPRVPSVLFLSEDDYVCGRYGDRTLSRYREMVSQYSGAACPSGVLPPEHDAIAAVTQEWLNEFERIQWMLRTSGRLREKHGD